MGKAEPFFSLTTSQKTLFSRAELRRGSAFFALRCRYFISTDDVSHPSYTLRPLFLFEKSSAMHHRVGHGKTKTLPKDSQESHLVSEHVRTSALAAYIASITADITRTQKQKQRAHAYVLFCYVRNVILNLFQDLKVLEEIPDQVRNDKKVKTLASPNTL